jgi:hypothetical protein
MSTTVTVTNPDAHLALCRIWLDTSSYTLGKAILTSSDLLARITAAGFDTAGSAFRLGYTPEEAGMVTTTGGREWAYDRLIYRVIRDRVREADRVDGYSKHRSLRHSIQGMTPYWRCLATVDVNELVTIAADASATEAMIAAILAP